MNHHPAPGYEGYVAVDLMPPGGGWAVAHDLRHPIPLPDGSVERIITEDFLEHLPVDMLPPLLAECHRLLAPGGTMRIAVPDYNNPKDRFAFDGMPHDRRNPEHITRTDRFMVERLLAASPFTDYRFVQYWDGDRFVEHPLDDSLGPVKRCPQHDPRCRRDGWRARLRGLAGDIGYLLRAGRRARLGELRSRPGRRWHVTSLIVDLTARAEADSRAESEPHPPVVAPLVLHLGDLDRSGLHSVRQVCPTTRLAVETVDLDDSQPAVRGRWRSDRHAAHEPVRRRCVTSVDVHRPHVDRAVDHLVEARAERLHPSVVDLGQIEVHPPGAVAVDLGTGDERTGELLEDERVEHVAHRVQRRHRQPMVGVDRHRDRPRRLRGRIVQQVPPSVAVGLDRR